MAKQPNEKKPATLHLVPPAGADAAKGKERERDSSDELGDDAEDEDDGDEGDDEDEDEESWATRLEPGKTTAGQLASALEDILSAAEPEAWTPDDPVLPEDVLACRERLAPPDRDAFDAAAGAILIVTAASEDDQRVITYFEASLLDPQIEDSRATMMLVAAIPFGGGDLLDIVAESWLAEGRSVAPLVPAIEACFTSDEVDLAEGVLETLGDKLDGAARARIEKLIEAAEDDALPEDLPDPLAPIDQRLEPDYSLRELLDDILMADEGEDDEDEDDDESEADEHERRQIQALFEQLGVDPASLERLPPGRLESFVRSLIKIAAEGSANDHLDKVKALIAEYGVSSH